MKNKIVISDYVPSDRPELLRMLIELHSNYFKQTSLKQVYELREDKDIRSSYSEYLDGIEQTDLRNWKILIAKSGTLTAGFIIGSIKTDHSMVFGKTGEIEDWFVEEKFRGNGLGSELYALLEKWFIKNKCDQVISATWEGNDLSIKVHEKTGFFKTGIKLAKKL